MSLPTPDSSGPPYVGPRSFTAGDRLYGRDREAQELCDLLISERIVLLHSPSGAGKTSLVQARLIPMLTEREFTVLPVIRVSQEPPARLAAGTNRYVLSLLLALQRALPEEEQHAVGDLGDLGLADLLATLPGAGDSQVLIFDQFEEILTVDPTSVEAKRQFFAEVGAALRDRSRWALFSMREDHLAALAPYLRPIPTRLSCTYRLDLLAPAAAVQAIREPARTRGATFEPGVVEGLVDDLRLVRVQHADGSLEEVPGPYVEPVQLQVVCLRLWKILVQRYSSMPGVDAMICRTEDVRSMGAVSNALADYYAECVAEVHRATGIAERTIRDWFDGQLITPRGIRNQVLQGHESTLGLPNSTVRALIDTYLVRAEQRRGLTWFELAHDRLIEPVLGSNSAWRDANLHQAQRQAALWEAQRRPDALLLREKELEAAEAWEARSAGALNSVEQEFLAASRELRRRERQARRAAWIIRLLSLAAFAFAIVATYQAFVANEERARAEVARDVATARQLAAQSVQIGARDPQRSLLLAVEAISISGREPLPEAVSALYRALAATGGVPLAGASPLSRIAFSPDGALLAAADRAGGITLWVSAEPGRPRATLAGSGAALANVLAFSPDGALIAAAGEDGVLRLWEAARPEREPALLDGHGGLPLLSLAFSPDGAVIATGGDDGSVRLWRAADLAAPPVALAGHAGPVEALSFALDGAALVSAATDLTASVWDVARPEAAPRSLEVGDSGIFALSVSPDGRMLAAHGGGESALIWDLAGPPAPPVLLAPDVGPITALGFSPGGRRLFVAGNVGAAVLYESANLDAPPQPLWSREEAVTTMAFTPDEATLVTNGPDGAVQVWTLSALQLRPLTLAGHASAIQALSVSPDGLHLVTLDEEGGARLWPLDTLSPVAALRGPTSGIHTVAIAGEGAAVVAADNTGAGTGWERRDGGSFASSPRHPSPFEGEVAAIIYSTDGRQLVAIDLFQRRLVFQDLAQPGPTTLLETDRRIRMVAISRDGRRVAALTTTQNNTEERVELWDTTDPAAPRQLDHLATTDGSALAFSADGALLATGHLDGLVQIWRIDNPASPQLEQASHDERITTLVFSADGALLASGDSGGAIRVWRVEGDEPPRALVGTGDTVDDLAFAPSGQILAAGGLDGLGRLWDLTTTGEPTLLTVDEGPIAALVFNADGTTLAVGGALGRVRLWPMQLEALRAVGCATAGRNLTPDEWREAFGAVAYRRTCPELPDPPGLLDAAPLAPGLPRRA